MRRREGRSKKSGDDEMEDDSQLADVEDIGKHRGGRMKRRIKMARWRG